MKIKSLLKLLTLAIIICSSCSKGQNEPTENLKQDIQKVLNITFRKENGAFYAAGTRYRIKSLHLFEFAKTGELSHSSSVTNFERIQYSSPFSEGMIVIVPNLTESQIVQYKALTRTNFMTKIEEDAEVYWHDNFSTIEPTTNITPMLVAPTFNPEF